MPDTLPSSLKALLRKLLDKSPVTRPSIEDLWQDDWITSDGRDLLPPYDENCVAFSEPTQAEVDRALNALRASTFLAMSVVAKLKGMRKRSASGDSGSPAPSEHRTSIDVGRPDLVESPLSSPLLSPSHSDLEPSKLSIEERGAQQDNRRPASSLPEGPSPPVQISEEPESI